MPITATIQIVRMNLTATRYSTPSGHAAAIVTSDPNRMATPRTDSRRPSHSGPCRSRPRSGLTTSVEPRGGVRIDGRRGGECRRGGGRRLRRSTVVVVTTGSVDTLNVMLPDPFGSPSVSLTSQLATQVPFGRAVGTGTVSVRLSAPTSGRPSVTSSVLHSSETVLASPNSSVNTIEISAGDVAIVDPSAGSELTTVASARTIPDSTSDPKVTTPRAIAATAVVRRRRRRAGRTAGSFTVGPRLVVGESLGREPRRSLPLGQLGSAGSAGSADARRCAHLGDEVVASEVELGDRRGQLVERFSVASGPPARGEVAPRGRLVLVVADQRAVVVVEIVGRCEARMVRPRRAGACSPGWRSR